MDRFDVMTLQLLGADLPPVPAVPGRKFPLDVLRPLAALQPVQPLVRSPRRRKPAPIQPSAVQAFACVAATSL